MSDDLDDLTIDLDDGNPLPLQPVNNKRELVFTEKTTTLPIMTTAEKVNVISARVRQLNTGYKSTIEVLATVDVRLPGTQKVKIGTVQHQYIGHSDHANF